MKGAYIFFANGFEETEALAPIEMYSAEEESTS